MDLVVITYGESNKRLLFFASEIHRIRRMPGRCDLLCCQEALDQAGVSTAAAVTALVLTSFLNSFLTVFGSRL